MTKKNNCIKKELYKNWQLYLILIIPVAYFILFKYMPLYGMLLAFKDFVASKGILHSPWVGLKHFKMFFNDYQFTNILRNTLLLSFYQLVAGFPLPICLAIALNYVRNKKFKKSIQMVTYAPHFISTVVVVGIMMLLFSTRTGIVNKLLVTLGFEEVNFFGNPNAFKHLYVWSGIWQNVGFNAIIYIATLSSIDPALYQAAVVDGANKFQRMIHIDLPGIMPTAIVLLILNCGRLLNIGHEKVLLLQNNINIPHSEIIATYVYKVGLQSYIPQFSYATAIGLFQSVISIILIVSVNKISQKVSDSSLW